MEGFKVLSVEEARKLCKDGMLHVDVGGQLRSAEWADSDLESIQVCKCPDLDSATIIKLSRLWVFGMLGGTLLDLPVLTIMLGLHVKKINDKQTNIIPLHYSTEQLSDATVAGYWEIIKGQFIALYDEMCGAPEFNRDVLINKLMVDSKITTLSDAFRNFMANAIKTQTNEERLKILLEFLVWTACTENSVVVSYGTFMSLSTLRVITSKEESAQTRLASSHGLQYQAFYKCSPFPPGLLGVSIDQLKTIKTVVSPSKISCISLLVPILKVVVLAGDPRQLVTREDFSVLQYCILMSTEYNGLYLAESYLRAIIETGETSGKILEYIWATKYEAQFVRLKQLITNYMDPKVQGRKAWKWSRLLSQDYLINYSAPRNDWLCAVLTAIFTEDDADPVWSKIVFAKKAELVVFAKRMGKLYRKTIRELQVREDDRILYKELEKNQGKLIPPSSSRPTTLDFLNREMSQQP